MIVRVTRVLPGIDAAHRLFDPILSEAENQRLFGNDAHLHGHRYQIQLTVEGEIDPSTGAVLDLRELDRIGRSITAELDHRQLEEVEWLRNRPSTVENVALAVFERCARLLPPRVRLVKVRVHETPNNYADVIGG